MNKILKVFAIVVVIAFIIFVWVFFINNEGRSVIYTNPYFTKEDIHPKIVAEVNKEFKLHLGQVASFKEGFQIMFTGYESGCGAGISGLKDLILKRAEASQCPDGRFAVFAVIKNGQVYEGYEYYINGVDITTVSSSEDEKSVVIKVTLLDKKLVEQLQTEQNNRVFENQANEKNNVDFCLKITEIDQKNKCILSVARETYYSMKNNIPTATEAARAVCKNIGYTLGICRIIGEKVPMTTQQCVDSVRPGDGWLGTGFYEDCFFSSMQTYGVDSNTCVEITDRSAKQICSEVVLRVKN
jgi:hypothetical protein